MAKAKKTIWSWVFHPITMIAGVNITWTVALLFWIFFFLKRYRQVTELAEQSVKTTVDFESWIPFVLGILLLVALFFGTIVLTLQLTRQAYDNKRIRRFLSAVSHELRTPITSIQLFLETMRDHELTPQEEKVFVEKMIQDVQRLSYQVSGILDATRLEHGRMPLRTEPIDLVAFVREFMHERQHPVGTAKHHHEISSSVGGTCLVEADRTALQTALENLVRNSELYSPIGSTIAVSVRRQGRWAIIDVVDEGIGIEPGELKSVFRIFFRTAAGKRSSSKGSGLGLYIVKGIAALHRGKVTVRSEGAGRGACFSFWLPCCDDANGSNV